MAAEDADGTPPHGTPPHGTPRTSACGSTRRSAGTRSPRTTGLATHDEPLANGGSASQPTHEAQLALPRLSTESGSLKLVWLPPKHAAACAVAAPHGTAVCSASLGRIDPCT